MSSVRIAILGKGIGETLVERTVTVIDQRVVDDPVDRGTQHNNREHPGGDATPAPQQRQHRRNGEDRQRQPWDQLFKIVPVLHGGEFERGGEDGYHGQCEETAPHPRDCGCRKWLTHLGHGVSAETILSTVS